MEVDDRPTRPRGIRSRLGMRTLSLSQRFFAIAVLVVVACMLALGAWIGNYLASGIARGVGETAAASIESLIVTRAGSPPSPAALSQGLEGVFQIANNATSSRLLQIRVRDFADNVLFQSLGGIEDESSSEALRRAAEGIVTSEVEELPLQAVGDIPSVALPVLKIYSPLRSLDNGETFAVAELYLSARAVRAIQAQAQVDVWIIVAVIGFLAIGLLAAIMDATGAVITRHRLALARNLLATRGLLEENRLLHKASEDLRVQAAVANERVLARVGSDIHDGPLQLMTLMILRLTRGGSSPQAADVDAAVSLSTQAMDELRAISSGLVLPELADHSLERVLRLAIQRYENQTGRAVAAEVELDGAEAGMDVKVCAYRFVQECLSNAFRHGDGHGEHVTARVDGETLVLGSSNHVRMAEEGEDVARDRLGLHAMRFRIQSVGGTLSARIGPELAHVEARIPLRPSQSQS
jgi:signal transduction histidine kinase